MGRAPQARLNDRDRVDAINQYTAEQLSPHLLNDTRLSDIVPTSDGNGPSLGQLAASGISWLEPLKCSWALCNGSGRLSLDPRRTQDIKAAANALRLTRNKHSHAKLGEPEEALAVRQAKNAAKSLLGLYGLTEAQKAIDDLALPPSIKYVIKLRDFLKKVATTPGRLPSYEETRTELGLSPDETGSRILFRQLNVLAAQQMILGEPQLCALVVDATTRIPGSGFYWIVDLDRNAPESEKRHAHNRAVEDIWAYNWSGR